MVALPLFLFAEGGKEEIISFSFAKAANIVNFALKSYHLSVCSGVIWLSTIRFYDSCVLI